MKNWNYIRETLKDYAKGKRITEEKLKTRKEELCKKHGIQNRELDSHKVYFMRGYCVVCRKHGFGNDLLRARHYHVRHDLKLEGQNYSAAMKKNVEAESWCKAMGAASKKKLEDEHERERKFIEDNADKIGLVTRRGAKALGEYHCYACREVLVGSLDAMGRHLEQHQTTNVTRLYYRQQDNTWHPAEQYFRVGGWCPAPGSLLKSYVIGGRKYSRGDVWECGNCSLQLKWEDEDTGQKGSRIMDKIEKHVQLFKTHGKCVEVTKKELREKVKKQIDKVAIQLGIEPESESEDT
jgi:hypothetical protein